MVPHEKEAKWRNSMSMCPLHTILLSTLKHIAKKTSESRLHHRYDHGFFNSTLTQILYKASSISKYVMLLVVPHPHNYKVFTLPHAKGGA